MYEFDLKNKCIYHKQVIIYVGGDEMFNVDTITLGMNFENKTQSYIDLYGNIKTRPDYKYLQKVEKKIKARLYLDSNNRLKRQKLLAKKKWLKDKGYGYSNITKHDYIYWFGQDKGYSFCYNETRHVLSITLAHYNIEEYTAKEIINNTRAKLIEYFMLESTELMLLTLRRIDYYCDYRYRDEEELLIIKQIMTRVTEQSYTYKKEITDTPETYVVKYLALKGNRQKYKDVKFNISRNTVIDKECELDETQET